MKGLIKKDLAILKKNMKTFLMLIVIYILSSLNSTGAESFIGPFMMAILCVSTFSYDEYNKWDAYAITLPGSRDNVVKAKYGIVLIMIAAAFVFAMIMASILGIIKGNFDLTESFVATLAGTASGLFVVEIMIPVIFKFGLEKARIIIIAASFGFSTIAVLFFTAVRIPEGTLSNLKSCMGFLLPLLMIVFFFGSYALSRRIYSKKEF